MFRRKFLAASGATLAGVVLAGCTGTDPDDGNEGETTSGNSGPGGTTAGGSAPSASFELVSSDLPEQVVMGESFTFSITVRNTGDTPAAFSSPIRVSGTDGGIEQSGNVETGEIPPGKTGTWSAELVHPYVATITYRIPNLETAFTIDVIGRQFSVGETFVGPTDVALTVQNVQLTSRYRYERNDGGAEEVEASNGRQWAFVSLRAENRFASEQTLPSPAEVVLVAGGEEHAPTDIARQAGRYESESVESGEAVEGWLAYDVPADVSAGDLSVEWQGSDNTGSWTVSWQP